MSAQRQTTQEQRFQAPRHEATKTQSSRLGTPWGDATSKKGWGCNTRLLGSLRLPPTQHQTGAGPHGPHQPDTESAPRVQRPQYLTGTRHTPKEGRLGSLRPPPKQHQPGGGPHGPHLSDTEPAPRIQRHQYLTGTRQNIQGDPNTLDPAILFQKPTFEKLLQTPPWLCFLNTDCNGHQDVMQHT